MQNFKIQVSVRANEYYFSTESASLELHTNLSWTSLEPLLNLSWTSLEPPSDLSRTSRENLKNI